MHKPPAILFVIILIIFSSCSFHDYYWEIPEDIQTKEDARLLMKSIEYVHSPYDNWQLPDHTYNSKKGDCEDTGSLLAYIMIYRLNYKNVKLVACEREDGVKHILVYADGKFYEGDTFEYPYREYAILYYMSLEEYLRKARYR